MLTVARTAEGRLDRTVMRGRDGARDVRGRGPGVLVEAADPMCAPGRIRTCDTRFRRAVLYPLSYERLSRNII